MHGGLSDTQQQEIIERFALGDTPVRVLFTGDVASEGVNMHRQCHHLIHYDLPWSLIRIEQRNGRIDRYGQEHQPEFAALILTSQTEGAKDDTTVAEKLLAARKRRPTASWAPRRASPASSPPRRKRTAWSRICSRARPWRSPLRRPRAPTRAPTSSPTSSAGVGDQPDDSAPDHGRACRACSRRPEEFARAALSAAAPELHVDDDGELLAFRAAGRPGAAALRTAAPT